MRGCHELTRFEQENVTHSFGEPDNWIDGPNELRMFVILNYGNRIFFKRFYWEGRYVEQIMGKIPHIIADGMDIVLLFPEIPDSPRVIHTWFRNSYFGLDVEMYTHENGVWDKLSPEGSIIKLTKREIRKTRKYQKKVRRIAKNSL